jgi:CubicO group peptidase (beta-lactamase class C family)
MKWPDATSTLNRRTFLCSTGAALPFLCVGHADAEVLATGTTHSSLSAFDKTMTDFVTANKVPGAALAITRNGRLIYARGFGYADMEKKVQVQPTSLFRIASVTKPFTATAVLQLVEKKLFTLETPVVRLAKLHAFNEKKGEYDQRWVRITVRHCLQHTGGWDRDKPKTGYDPVGMPREIAKAMKIAPAVPPEAIVRYMMGKPLDFNPGAKMVYSNLGYLVLGRVIATVTGEEYGAHLKKEVMARVGITSMSLARALPENRPKSEVKYYSQERLTGECLYPPREGKTVPLPDGGENQESFEAHGGWIASAPDLLRFARAFDNPAKSPLLQPDTIKTMFARPDGLAGSDEKGKPLDSYYGCGWNVVDLGGGQMNTWHNGFVVGQNSLLVRRFDGLNWAVLFNTDQNAKKQQLNDLIDPKLHEAADSVKNWPDADLFAKVQGK